MDPVKSAKTGRDARGIVTSYCRESTEMSGASSRDTFVRAHVRLVHHVARQLHRRLAVAVGLDELVSAGMLGLVAAADSYDPRRGVRFSTFAVPRIRGAILDELRRMDVLPRRLRKRLRMCQSTRRSLAAKLQRQPDASEVAATLGVGLAHLEELERNAALGAPLSWEAMSRSAQQGVAPAVDLAAEIEDRLSRQQLVARVRTAMTLLGEQERTVLALCYFEELKLRDVGLLLGVSASRVSQIRSRALLRLRQLARQTELVQIAGELL
jgi:RNA polymerase sigma factor for flagellar operon FliA